MTSLVDVSSADALRCLRGLAFHHIGVACRDLDLDEKTFSILGYEREGEDFFDPLQGVHGRFLVGGGPRIELLRNHGDEGVLSSWIRKGTKFYHVAYEVDDLAAASEVLCELGAKATTQPMPAVAFGGRLITFFMLQNLSLVELIGRS